jgi:hypothetical protein
MSVTLYSLEYYENITMAARAAASMSIGTTAAPIAAARPVSLPARLQDAAFLENEQFIREQRRFRRIVSDHDGGAGEFALQ